VRPLAPSLTVAIALASCALAPPAPSLAPGPRAFGCVPIEEAILGVWQRDGVVEEFRADGTYLLNGQEGAFRWRMPGHVVLDAAGIHAEHVVGLTSLNELISADENLRGHVSGRISPPPSIPVDCYDVRTSIVGTWIGGAAPVTFERGAGYAAGDRIGIWSMPANGHLSIRIEPEGTTNHLFAQLSDTTAMSLVAEDGAAVTLYTRGR
jgi:hypothetical protein